MKWGKKATERKNKKKRKNYIKKGKGEDGKNCKTKREKERK